MAFSLETIVAWAKRRGFAYPGSEIYGGLANARDLGPYGAQLRKHIIDTWRRCFIQEREDMVGMDAAILMNPKVWEASGHIAGFSDPLVDCKQCKSRERADQLIESSAKGEVIAGAWSFEEQYVFLQEHRIPCPKC